MNPFAKFFERSESQKEIEAFRQKFADKPFYIEYRSMYQISKFSRYGLGLLSALSGAAWGASVLFVTGLPLWVAGLIALALALLIETLKSISGEKTAKTYLKEKRLGVPALAVLFLAGLSTYISLKGVETIHANTDQTITTASASADARVDSLRSYYDAQIRKEETALADYKKSVSWQGRIDASNRTTRQVIEMHTAQISRLQKEKAEHLDKMQAENDASILQANEKSSFNLSAFLVMCLANEVCIVLAIMFCYYYEYRSSAEAIVTDERLSVGLTELREIVQFFSPGPAGLTLPAFGHDEDPGVKRKIGFNPSEDDPENKPETRVNPGLTPGLTPPKSPLKTQQELRAFLAKYRHVVQAIEAGHTVASITEKYNLSRSTVKNVRRCMQVLASTSY